MLKKTLTLALALVIAMAAGSAFAQCSIGAYADASGVSGAFAPTELTPFNLYVVLFTEDLVNAAAYRLQVPQLGTALINSGTAYGPSGGGLGVTVPLGGDTAGSDLSVGLGECAVGFGGFPILVTTYTFLPLAGFAGGFADVLPNVNENPTAPVYSDCQGIVKSCDNTVSGVLDAVIATDSTSMSAVKSLYN